MIKSPLLRLIFALSLVGLLSACVHPTPYQQAPPRGFGYNEDRLDQNRYRITFRGNSSTPRETVEDYLLYRAAELTLQNGFDHFIMVGRDTEAKTSYRYWVDLYGRRGYFYHGFPRWHHDPWHRDPWGRPSYDVEPVTTYTATAEIIMIRGPRRDRDIEAFDARQVLAQVGPRVVRPEQQSH
ncbi:MAG: hypothetical protein GC190_01995 [Alphaproteobacteria bacterium]|nr:hypothetical protein [Alphaproteobacteria bacterium]